MGNTQRGVVLMNAGLESRRVRWSCVACLLLGVIVCFAYSGSPTQLIFLANLATSIGTPTAGLFVTLMIWRKDVQAGLKPPRLLQLTMTLCYLFTTALTLYSFGARFL